MDELTDEFLKAYGATPDSGERRPDFEVGQQTSGIGSADALMEGGLNPPRPGTRETHQNPYPYSNPPVDSGLFSAELFGVVPSDSEQHGGLQRQRYLYDQSFYDHTFTTSTDGPHEATTSISQSVLTDVEGLLHRLQTSKNFDSKERLINSVTDVQSRLKDALAKPRKSILWVGGAEEQQSNSSTQKDDENKRHMMNHMLKVSEHSPRAYLENRRRMEYEELEAIVHRDFVAKNEVHSTMEKVDDNWAQAAGQNPTTFICEYSARSGLNFRMRPGVDTVVTLFEDFDRHQAAIDDDYVFNSLHGNNVKTNVRFGSIWHFEVVHRSLDELTELVDSYDYLRHHKAYLQCTRGRRDVICNTLLHKQMLQRLVDWIDPLIETSYEEDEQIEANTDDRSYMSCVKSLRGNVDFGRMRMNTLKAYLTKDAFTKLHNFNAYVRLMAGKHMVFVRAAHHHSLNEDCSRLDRLVLRRLLDHVTKRGVHALIPSSEFEHLERGEDIQAELSRIHIDLVSEVNVYAPCLLLDRHLQWQDVPKPHSSDVIGNNDFLRALHTCYALVVLLSKKLDVIILKHSGVHVTSPESDSLRFPILTQLWYRIFNGSLRSEQVSIVNVAKVQVHSRDGGARVDFKTPIRKWFTQSLLDTLSSSDIDSFPVLDLSTIQERLVQGTLLIETTKFNTWVMSDSPYIEPRDVDQGSYPASEVEPISILLGFASRLFKSALAYIEAQLRNYRVPDITSFQKNQMRHRMELYAKSAEASIEECVKIIIQDFDEQIGDKIQNRVEHVCASDAGNALEPFDVYSRDVGLRAFVFGMVNHILVPLMITTILRAYPILAELDQMAADQILMWPVLDVESDNESKPKVALRNNRDRGGDSRDALQLAMQRELYDHLSRRLVQSYDEILRDEDFRASEELHLAFISGVELVLSHVCIHYAKQKAFGIMRVVELMASMNSLPNQLRPEATSEFEGVRVGDIALKLPDFSWFHSWHLSRTPHKPVFLPATHGQLLT